MDKYTIFKKICNNMSDADINTMYATEGVVTWAMTCLLAEKTKRGI